MAGVCHGCGRVKRNTRTTIHAVQVHVGQGSGRGVCVCVWGGSI